MVNQKTSVIRKILYISLGVLLIISSLIILIIILPNIAGLFPIWDIDKIDDSDLSFEKIEIPKEENAFYDLDEIKDVIYNPDNKGLLFDLISGEAWDQDFVDNLLLENEEALNYFNEAAQKELFQDTYCDSPEDIIFYNPIAITWAWREMAQISEIKALSLLKENKIKEAINEAFKSLEISQKIQNSQTYIIEYLVASAMKRIGLDDLTKIISSPNISTNELKDIASRLEEFYDDREGLRKVIISEYLIKRSEIEALTSKNDKIANKYLKNQYPDLFEKTDNNYYFQPNETLKMFADQTRIEINNTTKTYNQISPSKIEKSLPYYWYEKYMYRNLIGEMFYQQGSFDKSSLIEMKYEEELLVSITQLYAALKAYKLEHGMLPDSLSDLVSEYISSIPIDPFDGNPIRYSVQKEILYSVGKNSIDEGGSTGDNWEKMPDPTFKIDF